MHLVNLGLRWKGGVAFGPRKGAGEDIGACYLGRMRRYLPFDPMALFALASLTPLVLLALGAVLGGGWAALGLLYMAVFTALMDRLFRWVAPDAPEGAEFPAADAVLVAIAVGHLLALPLAVWAIGGPSGLPPVARVLLFLGFGQYFGQVSNPAAHELIHRGRRGLYRLGVAIYVTLLNGHHASAHRLVHHRFVASADDPNSARAGETFYAFLPRAYFGSFKAGLQAETARQTRGRLHPYALYMGGTLGCLALALATLGLWGGVVWGLLGLYATAQLMLSDYVQHYGLRRATLPDGRLEPVSDRHSWNAPQWFSSAVMLNAPRHSDHHAHPARPYPALRLPESDSAPMLPYALPVCCMVALMPRLWRRMMRKPLARWQALPPA